LALSAKLTREERLRIQAQYFELVEQWNEAAERYRHLWDFAPEDLDYGLHYAGTLRAAGKFKEALEIISAVRASPATPQDDPRVDLSEARLYLMSGGAQRALQLAEAAALKSLRLNLRLPLGEARLIIGRARQSLGDAAGACEAFQEAEAVYRSAGFSAGSAAAFDGLSLSLSSVGDLRSALEANDKALSIYRSMGEHKQIALVLGHRAELLALQKQTSAADRVMSEAVEISRRGGNSKLSAELSNLQEDLRSKSRRAKARGERAKVSME
jgi:tetratricopeptide (TPR) repeat protein